MKFEENLRELRKQHGLSQEELAERLAVSRQSVSKWENGSASPELEKLLQLCDMFHCTLDDLLKGDIEEGNGCSKELYDKEKNIETILVCIGVSVIILGLSLYEPMVERLSGNHQELANPLFLIFVLVGVICFVTMGMKASFFEKRYPKAPLGIYTETEIHSFEQRFGIGITVGVALIIVSFIVQQLGQIYVNEVYANSLFLFIVMIGVCDLVYFGMQKGKYENTLHAPVKNETDERFMLYASIIMIIATGIYFIWSFVGNAWEISWCVFVIGALLCGIVCLWMKRNDIFGNK